MFRKAQVQSSFSGAVRWWWMAVAGLALVPALAGLALVPELPELALVSEVPELALVPAVPELALVPAVPELALVPGAEGGDFIPLIEDVLDTLDSVVKNLLELPLGYNVKDDKEFEYVVVGAGAAGCAVAARLVQQGKSVLLLEAGRHPPPHAYVPYLAPYLAGTSIDWQYETRPNNKSCFGSDGEQCRWSRGKALGGSTVINYMMYVRGNHQDYELGLPGWTWRELEPYFLRAEGLRSRLPLSSRPYHNTSGPVTVGFCPDPENTWHQRIYQGFQQLGFPENPDVNGDSQIGVSRVITYTGEGLRESSARAYLSIPGVKRKLKLSLGTQVTEVLFNKEYEAFGVKAVRDITGREITVRASKGVILSAGAIGTPQILMLSGIGPKAHLEDFNIPVRSNLPVGEEVSDHVTPLVFIRVSTGLLEAVKYGEQVIKYGLSRSGPLASVGLIDITALVNTTCYDFEARTLNDGPGCDLPTFESATIYVERGLLTLGTPIFKNVLPLKNEIIAQLAKENAVGGIILVLPIVLNPYSRGKIRLASSNPLKQPDIFPNYLSDDRDVDEMERIITILEHLVETKPFQEHEAKIVRLKLDGCPSYEEDRVLYWRCYAKHLTYSIFHAVGSCALGRVLDERLRVRGVRRLRVADLSAMPKVPHGNTAATAIAFGERLADFLMEDENS